MNGIPGGEVRPARRPGALGRGGVGETPVPKVRPFFLKKLRPSWRTSNVGLKFLFWWVWRAVLGDFVSCSCKTTRIRFLATAFFVYRARALLLIIPRWLILPQCSVLKHAAKQSLSALIAITVFYLY